MTWADALPTGTRFHGGLVCFDYANTTEQLRSAQPRDWLINYRALLAWSVVRGTLRETVGEKLSKAAEENDAAAAEVFHDALLLRATIRNFADAAMRRADISEPLDALNRRLHSLPAQPPISIDRDGGRGLFTLEGQHLAEPLWPVVWSFTALITAGDASRIRQCEGEGCGYIYLDTTLNQSRRYCSSSGCGNRARARRHYHRVQAGDVSPGSSED